MSATDSQTEHRSVSRGRQPFVSFPLASAWTSVNLFFLWQSTGRGGVGNIRRPSAVSPSTDTRPDSGPDDFSQTRGRELKVSSTHQVLQFFVNRFILSSLSLFGLFSPSLLDAGV